MSSPAPDSIVDAAWVRAQGLDAAIARHAAAGRRVLGICGGLQMLGSDLRDPHGVDGAAPGLGLLPLTTQFERHKLLRHTRARFAALEGDWKRARDLHLKLYPVCKAMFIETNPIPVKEAMAMLGMIRAEWRLPMCPMTPANREKLRQALVQAGVLKA